MMKFFTVLAALLLVAGLVFADEGKKTESAPDSTEEKAEPEVITTESGLKYADLVVGEGKEAVKGMKVECHYTLWFADEKGEKGKLFQSSKDMGKPFSFEVGHPGLIKGWNEGMMGMKEGGVRRLIIPPDLGYGANPNPRSGIPKNQTLIFELEFIKAL